MFEGGLHWVTDAFILTASDGDGALNMKLFEAKGVSLRKKQENDLSGY